MKYRRDLDGLRAVATIPVIFYHLAVPHFGGGYIGVDIFFVISGFLIAGQLQADMDGGRFSVRRFYERRVRRIAPALLAMLIATSLVGLLLMLPTELQHFGESSVAAVFSTANIYLWQHSNYFAGDARLQPLLHTWSLGVEEQYYVLFPLVLCGARNWPRRRRNGMFVALFAASAIWGVTAPLFSDTAGFYLLPSRIWEFLAGVFLALGIVPAPRSDLARNVCAALGLALILLAYFLARFHPTYSGILLFLPCAGAALVIAGGAHGKTATGRLLESGVLVFIGLISYSLYLWHWPMIYFALRLQLLLGVPFPVHVAQAAIFALSLAVGTLSWQFVEKPTRNREAMPVVRLMRLCGGGAFAALVLGCVFWFSGGLPERFAPDVVRTASFLDYTAPYFEGPCFVHSRGRQGKEFSPSCLEAHARPNYLLIGDSHSADLEPGLRPYLAGRLQQVSIGSCAPLRRPIGDRYCRRVMEMLYDKYIPENRPSFAILSALWTPQSLPAIAQTMTWWSMHDTNVIIVGPSPQYGAPLPSLLAWSMLTGKRRLPQIFTERKAIALDAAMAQLAAARHLRYFSLIKLLCTGEACRTRVGDVPVSFDQGHFTVEASQLIGRAMNAQGVVK